eukprot:TRINITY_DN35208_c0_g1_i1.p1 TRINITY_DN35208_c0_g1~~TRINITY_DN35208_c0_g1_i1.p1  ORF type:complete len:232 (-),score=49.06 TRINITY_DN35208_c0_g1_i1:125-787(-)
MVPCAGGRRRREWNLLLLLLAVLDVCVRRRHLPLSANFVCGPRPGWTSLSSTGHLQKRAATEQEVSDKLDEVLKKKLKGASARFEADSDALKADSGNDEKAEMMASRKQKESKALAKSKKRGLTRKNLDEVLASANDEEAERPSFLPARRDVYKEVGITRAEVENYYTRREEAAGQFWSKNVTAPGIVIGILLFLAATAVFIESAINPQEEYTTSMVGTG